MLQCVFIADVVHDFNTVYISSLLQEITEDSAPVLDTLRYSSIVKHFG